MFSVFVFLVVFDNLLSVSDCLCLAVNVFNKIVDVFKLFLLFFKEWFTAEFDVFSDSSVPLVSSSELLPGMNSAPVGSFPKFSSGFSENLVGGLLILPDRVVCSAVLLVVFALLLAGALGKGLLPFSCYY
jgi:hypothetical protein